MKMEEELRRLKEENEKLKGAAIESVFADLILNVAARHPGARIWIDVPSDSFKAIVLHVGVQRDGKIYRAQRAVTAEEIGECRVNIWADTVDQVCEDLEVEINRANSSSSNGSDGGLRE